MRLNTLSVTKRIFAWSLCAVLTMGLACDSCGTEESGHGDEALEFSVALWNRDATTNVHLFTPGEDFPCCQVAPRLIRDVDLSGVSTNEDLTFSVGRNGVILKAVTCTVRNAAAGKGVDWQPTADGASTGSLTCVNW